MQVRVPTLSSLRLPLLVLGSAHERPTTRVSEAATGPRPAEERPEAERLDVETCTSAWRPTPLGREAAVVRPVDASTTCTVVYGRRSE